MLKADSTMFIKSMKRTIESLKNFGRWAMRVTKWITGIALALSGLGAFSLSRIFNEAMKEADKIGKLSDEIGSTVDSMFALKHASEITGTSFAVMTKGLQRMNRRIGEAAQGYGEAVKGIQQLGLRTDELMKLGAFEQFSAIAEAMRNLGSQTQKSAAVYTLFGRQGQELINTFQLGKVGMRDMANETEHLLGKFSRGEFRVFEEMNDSVVRLNLAAKGLMLRLGTEFSQIIGAGLKELAELLVAIRLKHLPAMAEAVRGLVRSGISALQKWMPYIVAIGELFWSVGVLAFDLIKGLGMAITLQMRAVFKVLRVVSDVGAHFGLWESRVDGVTEGLSGVTGMLHFISVGARNLGLVFSTLSTFIMVSMRHTWDTVWLGFNSMLMKIFHFAKVGVLKLSIMIEKAFSGDKVSDHLIKYTRQLIQAKRQFEADTRTLASQSISLEEMFDITGLSGDIEELVGKLNDDPNKKGGFTDKINAMLDRVMNFKLGIPPVNPSGQLIDVARTLQSFTQAAEFGSQASVEIMARAQMGQQRERERQDAETKQFFRANVEAGETPDFLPFSGGVGSIVEAINMMTEQLMNKKETSLIQVESI
tara:strand:+ start:14341 stop:16119 length:1779 start_codon:yes stop_codon:yes gene_type:complete